MKKKTLFTIDEKLKTLQNLTNCESSRLRGGEEAMASSTISFTINPIEPAVSIGGTIPIRR